MKANKTFVARGIKINDKVSVHRTDQIRLIHNFEHALPTEATDVTIVDASFCFVLNESSFSNYRKAGRTYKEHTLPDTY